jgi:hypothetical protein
LWPAIVLPFLLACFQESSRSGSRQLRRSGSERNRASNVVFAMDEGAAFWYKDGYDCGIDAGHRRP